MYAFYIRGEPTNEKANENLLDEKYSGNVMMPKQWLW